jgi:hypothetical protein
MKNNKNEKKVLEVLANFEKNTEKKAPKASFNIGSSGAKNAKVN